MDMLVLAQPQSLIGLYIWSCTEKNVLTELPRVISVDGEWFFYVWYSLQKCRNWAISQFKSAG